MGQPAQQAFRISTDAEVAVGEQDVVPAAGPGQAVEHGAGQDQRSPGAGDLDGGRGDVDAERGQTSQAQGDREPARSAADVKGRAGAAGE